MPRSDRLSKKDTPPTHHVSYPSFSSPSIMVLPEKPYAPLGTLLPRPICLGKNNSSRSATFLESQGAGRNPENMAWWDGHVKFPGAWHFCHLPYRLRTLVVPFSSSLTATSYRRVSRQINRISIHPTTRLISTDGSFLAAEEANRRKGTSPSFLLPMVLAAPSISCANMCSSISCPPTVSSFAIPSSSFPAFGRSGSPRRCPGKSDPPVRSSR